MIYNAPGSNVQAGWDTRISGVARAWVSGASMGADGSVFLIGIGEEEAFDFDSVVVHLNSSGGFLWDWKVRGEEKNIFDFRVADLETYCCEYWY